MTRRTELTLFGLLGLAVVSTILLIAGQVTGKFKIFGDTMPASGVQSLPVIPIAVTSNSQTLVRESFESTVYLDAEQTTADWNIEAGELTLSAGKTEGLGQSTTVSSLLGEKVRVTFEADIDQPMGSSLYFSVSADGGQTWQPVFSGRSAVFEKPNGDPSRPGDRSEADWRWRALLKRGTASSSPAVKSIEMKLAGE